MDEKNEIWAVVLAAGESRRMGEPKVLLPYGRSTILETVLQNVLASRVDGIVVVLGSRWRKIKKMLKGDDIKVVINRRFREGMLSSVQRGMSALPSSSQAAVIVLGDQPAIPTTIINSLINAYRRKKKGLAVPVYRGKRGHPLLFDLKYRQEIIRLNPAVGLRQLLELHPQDILEVKVSTSSILRDIDNPTDYKKLRGRRPRRLS